jgi:hypothetical protein
VILGESKILQHLVGDRLHLVGADLIMVIEADGQVIHRHLYHGALARCRLHQRRRELRLVGAEIPARRPGDAICLDPRSSVHEVVGQRTEPSTA